MPKFVQKIDLNPKKDGLTHINIYSQGQTELGRLLSNFADTPFVCDDGEFQSVEGYWYWLRISEALGFTSHHHNVLRSLHGKEAKGLGRSLFERYVREGDAKKPSKMFQDRILKAIRAKLNAHSFILDELKATDLPFVHYYVMSEIVTAEETTAERIIDKTEENLFIIQFYNGVRDELKGGLFGSLWG